MEPEGKNSENKQRTNPLEYSTVYISFYNWCYMCAYMFVFNCSSMNKSRFKIYSKQSKHQMFQRTTVFIQ